MTIIGITGGSGAGKTTALGVLAELGACIIDCDAVYHKLLETSRPLLAELEGRFPGAFVDGVFHRKALGTIVFNDAGALGDLNRITHRYVATEVDATIARHRERGGALVAVDAIALVESGLNRRCSAVVGIVAPVETRVGRLTRREGVTEAYARLRISSQKPDSFFYENCDLVLENDYASPEAFQSVCRDCFAELITRHEREECTNGNS